MKRTLVAAALLLLTACSPSSSYVKGEVVSCETISQDSTFTGGVQMDCLDRSEGAQLGALRGPMVVNVWGSWCGPCRKEAKELQELYVKNKDSGVEFIGINIRDSKVSAEKFITNFGVTYPNIFDRDGVKLLGFKDTLPANAIPSTVLVYKNGKVAARQLGPIERALIQGFISSLVDE